LKTNGFFGSLNGSVSVLLGAGRSNIALAAYLSKCGGRVMICDRSLSEKEIVKIAEENKIGNCAPIKYGTLPKADLVFRTPVIRPDDGLISSFVSRGAYLTSETELFFENKEPLLFEIDSIISSLTEYRDALETGDRDKMRDILREGRVAKEEIDG